MNAASRLLQRVMRGMLGRKYYRACRRTDNRAHVRYSLLRRLGAGCLSRRVCDVCLVCVWCMYLCDVCDVFGRVFGVCMCLVCVCVCHA